MIAAPAPETLGGLVLAAALLAGSLGVAIRAFVRILRAGVMIGLADRDSDLWRTTAHRLSAANAAVGALYLGAALVLFGLAAQLLVIAP